MALFKKNQGGSQPELADNGGVYRIKPFHYIHVHDNNTGSTDVIVGPKTFTRQDHEKVVFGPEQMIIIPPRHYVIIQNPVIKGANGEPAKNEHGNYKIRHGDEEIRFTCNPFPLYPGEVLSLKVTPLQVIPADSALRLRCIRDFEDDNGKHIAGDEWLIHGPGTYFPKIEVQVAETIKATVVLPSQGVKLRARKATTDCNGVARRAGEEYLWRGVGSFLPGVDEEIVEIVNATVLTDKKALHLRAIRTYVDQFNAQRKAGEEWLITNKESEFYIPDVHEEIVGQVNITVINNRQYAVILDPIGADGKPQFGKKVLVKGETSFFLRPGEHLEKGIQSVIVLGNNEALLLRAKEEIEGHKPGDRWMIVGPCDYIPPVQVEILEKREAIALSENEGVYIRDITSGKVRAHTGSSYLLNADEELYEKELTPIVEDLVTKLNGGGPRDKTRVVSVRVPHNAAVQIFDYINKNSRVIFGPELVKLDPDEHFTVLSLSGGKPKKPHVIHDLCLLLGPDFMTDIVTVETSDHARLQLQLSYNWKFEVKKGDENANCIFQVPDFVGDACKAIASSVREAVAAVPFDQFHRSSARIIRIAVFGTNEHGKVNDRFVFQNNGLIITNIDIQSVEPVDQRTRDSLQKSVQLAIEITTKSQEATAKHEAEKIEQEARGRLERQKITDEAEAEKQRQDLLSLQAQSSAVETTGQATAEAKARSEAAHIQGSSDVNLARLKAESMNIELSVEIENTTQSQSAQIEHQKAMDELEIARAKKLAEIESQKFKKIISTIGPETIASIAQAGPEMQAKLLKGLGIQSLMITDGNSPINLFNTAQGLIGGINNA